MDLSGIAKQIIHALTHERFYTECPCCLNTIRLRDAHLFHLDNFTPEVEKLYEERVAQLREKAKDLRDLRKNISKRSEVGAKSINIGFILERLAPAMKSFRFNTNDCRSLFDPIDYVIFEGLSAKGRVERILFAEIKTGSAQLNKHQKEIRAVIEKKRLSWDVYRQEVKK